MHCRCVQLGAAGLRTGVEFKRQWGGCQNVSRPPAATPYPTLAALRCKVAPEPSAPLSSCVGMLCVGMPRVSFGV